MEDKIFESVESVLIEERILIWILCNFLDECDVDGINAVIIPKLMSQRI